MTREQKLEEALRAMIDWANSNGTGGGYPGTQAVAALSAPKVEAVAVKPFDPNDPTRLRTLARETHIAPAKPLPPAHPDDIAVERFAAAMKAKLARKRDEGRGGWEDPEQCSGSFLSQLLREHVEKGDPLDVGNLAMMLHQRGERIADDRERYRETRKQKLAPSLPLNGGSSTSAKREATKRAALLAAFPSRGETE